ncbi:MAG TPA: hypothetical protein VFW87_10305 [Pirellulales bacterium]|nr:hypothetical protein [Pirellulales bacterium]
MFVEEHGIAWPNGYGLGRVQSLAPVIYVIGADGRIAWHDAQSRYHHQAEGLGSRLGLAIERALADAESHEANPLDTSPAAPDAEIVPAARKPSRATQAGE